MDNDIELEIGRAAAPGRYQVHVVSSPAGGDQREEFDLDVERLLRSRPGLEAGILSSAVGARRVLATAEQPVREVGQHLFEALFRRSVYGAYRASLGVAQQQGERLRVVLRFTAPELAALPWETLFDPERQTYVCRQEPMVRRIPAQFNPRAPLQVEPPLQVLAMVASPRGLPLLDVERERANLDEALRELTTAGLVEVTWVEQASWRSVHEQLLSGHWHVVHFIGHGDYDEGREEGILAFVGRDGRADLVEAGRFADLLGEAEPTPRLVVLNACSSGEGGGNDILSATAPALVHSGIEAVAAMQFAVSDEAAIAFAQGFYTAIAQSRGVDEAARSGRIAILGAAGSLEWLTPVLYLRGDSTHPIVMTPARRGRLPRPRDPEPGPDPTPGRAAPADEGEPVDAVDDRTPTLVVPVAPEAASRRRARLRWVGAVVAGVVVLAAAGLVALVLRPSPAAAPPRLSVSTVLVPTRDPANTVTRIYAYDEATGTWGPWTPADDFTGATATNVGRYSATPSRDRTKVAYVQGVSRFSPVVYVAGPQGQHPHRLMTSPDRPCDHAKRPAWNSDGTRLAVVCVLPGRTSSLWIVRADDGARVRQVVPASRGLNLGAPSWDVAGHEIFTWQAPPPPPSDGLGKTGTPVFVSDRSSDATLHAVPHTRGDTYTDPDWASPGLLMVHAAAAGNRIVVVGPRSRWVVEGQYQSAAWSPDGTQVVAVLGAEGPADKRLVTFDYPDKTPVPTRVTGQFGVPAWGSR